MQVRERGVALCGYLPVGRDDAFGVYDAPRVRGVGQGVRDPVDGRFPDAGDDEGRARQCLVDERRALRRRRAELRNRADGGDDLLGRRVDLDQGRGDVEPAQPVTADMLRWNDPTSPWVACATRRAVVNG